MNQKIINILKQTRGISICCRKSSADIGVYINKYLETLNKQNNAPS